jgi:hypothetical protein
LGALAVTLALGTAHEAHANAAAAEAPGAGAPAGTVARRSTFDHNLTSDDRASIGELGLGQQVQAGAVVIRKISKNDGKQIERLRQLVAALDGFKPAGLCEKIVGQGFGRALCTATTEGPLGSLPVRLPMAAKLEPHDAGTRLTLRNERSLEVKVLFSWMEIVRPNNIQLAFDLMPQPDGWLLYTRVGVNLAKRQDTADKLCKLLLKLDTWLAQDLARS